MQHFTIRIFSSTALILMWAERPPIINHYTVSTQQRLPDMFVVRPCFRLFLQNEPMHQRDFFLLLHVKRKCFCWCTNRNSYSCGDLGYPSLTVSEPRTETAPLLFIHYNHGNVSFKVQQGAVFTGQTRSSAAAISNRNTSRSKKSRLSTEGFTI